MRNLFVKNTILVFVVLVQLCLLGCQLFCIWQTDDLVNRSLLCVGAGTTWLLVSLVPAILTRDSTQRLRYLVLGFTGCSLLGFTGFAVLLDQGWLGALAVLSPFGYSTLALATLLLVENGRARDWEALANKAIASLEEVAHSTTEEHRKQHSNQVKDVGQND